MTDPRRGIPSVDRLLSSAPFSPMLTDYPRALVTSLVRSEVDRLRSARESTDETAIAASVRDRLNSLEQGTLRRVVNATGVVLHTNLGRAPLAAVAVESMSRAATGYCNLEYDIESGTRGSRYDHCRALLVDLTGAEDALVVNNNAAALVLALNTLAQGRAAIVSRGELVEIGGSFRVPDIMSRSGAVLTEVGATNRTHLKDYAEAITPETGALLKVHPSNFTVSGYVSEVTVAELASLANRSGVPLIHDIGSGLMVEPSRIGLPADEPTAATSLAARAGVVTMSGDKLLGGPQCGILLGDALHIDRMRRNPLCRAMRVDKLTLAALAATLSLYLRPERALSEIPTLRMLAMPIAHIEERARALAAKCEQAGMECRIVASDSAVGGGAAPGASLPTALLVVRIAGTAATLERALRRGQPAIITRMADGDVAFDLRTVEADDDDIILDALERLLKSEMATS